MTDKDKQIPVPDEILQCPCWEMMRIWVVVEPGELACEYALLRDGLCPDPTDWGALLARIARQTAWQIASRSAGNRPGMEPTEGERTNVLERICEGFTGELACLEEGDYYLGWNRFGPTTSRDGS